MMKTYDSYGIVLTSGELSLLYKVNGPHDISLLCSVKHHAQKKQKHGGYSAARIGRLRVEKNNVYHKKVLERMKQYYISHETNKPNVKSIVIAGPAETKTLISKHDMMDYRISPLISHIISCDDFTNDTVIDIVSNHISFEDEDECVMEWLDDISCDGGLAVYGKDEVSYYASMHMLRKIIIHESYDDEEHTYDDVVKTRNHKIMEYGGIVGLLYYKMNY